MKMREISRGIDKKLYVNNNLKKQPELLKKWLPVIKEGYITNSDKPRDIAEQEVDEFMKIFIDSASYSFGYNHAIAYSMLTYMTAYVRYYYPLEFIASYLNNATNDDDIINGTKYCEEFGIEICNPQFGMSKDRYSVSGGKIYKGLESIIGVSANVANELYEISQKYKEKDLTFLELVDIIKNECKSANKTNINTLIKVGYFSMFGGIKTLLKIYQIHSQYNKSKRITKGTNSLIDKICMEFVSSGDIDFKETKSQFSVNGEKLTKKLCSLLPDKDAEDMEKIEYQLSYLNYIQDKELLNKNNICLVKYKSFKNNSVCLYSLSEEKEFWVKGGQYFNQLDKEDFIIVYKLYTLNQARRSDKCLGDIYKITLDRKKRS